MQLLWLSEQWRQLERPATNVVRPACWIVARGDGKRYIYSLPGKEHISVWQYRRLTMLQPCLQGPIRGEMSGTMSAAQQLQQQVP